MNRIGVTQLEDALTPFGKLRAGSNPLPEGEGIIERPCISDQDDCKVAVVGACHSERSEESLVREKDSSPSASSGSE